MARSPALLLAVAALAGCVSHSPEPATIEAQDPRVFQPVLRASANFQRERVVPSHAQGGHGVELGFTRASGDDTQITRAGQQPVVFGNQTFASPQELRHEFEFQFADLSYRWRRYFGAGRAVAIEALAGAGLAKLDLTVSSAAQNAHESLDSGGALGAVGLVWRFLPGTSLQSRFMLYLSGSDTGVANAQCTDFFVAQALGPNLGLRAGYRVWHAETDRGRRDSNINLKFRGPALGLEVMF